MVALLAGCATAPNGTKTIDAQRVGRIAGRAAYVGGVIYLKSKPEDRGRFEMAVTALKVLEASDNPDASAMAAALKGLPISELKGDDGWLIVQAACAVWDLVLSERVPIEQPALVKVVAPQVRMGLERALAETK